MVAGEGEVAPESLNELRGLQMFQAFVCLVLRAAPCSGPLLLIRPICDPLPRQGQQPPRPAKFSPNPCPNLKPLDCFLIFYLSRPRITSPARAAPTFGRGGGGIRAPPLAHRVGEGDELGVIYERLGSL